KAAKTLLPALTLPIALYIVWRSFVLSGFAGGELRSLPFADWHWSLLAQILDAIGSVIAEKGILYGTFAATALVFALRVKRYVLDLPNQALLFAALLFITYTGVMIGAYLCVFPEQWSVKAHSYYRWSAHVALIPMLAFVLVACEFRGQQRRWSS